MEENCEIMDSACLSEGSIISVIGILLVEEMDTEVFMDLELETGIERNFKVFIRAFSVPFLQLDQASRCTNYYSQFNQSSISPSRSPVS